MSVNSSSSALLDFHCKDSGYFISVALLVTKVSLLLPLLIFILYIGHQRWQRQPSSAATSHSDIFTYHLAAIELVFMLAIALYFCGSFTGLLWMTKAGFYVSALVIPGEICLHLLACVERYLAVVHPVTYMGLRQSAGVKIRNISIGAGGNEWGQGAGRPIKAEGFLHRYGHYGSAVVVFCGVHCLSCCRKLTAAGIQCWVSGADNCKLDDSAQQSGLTSAVSTQSRKAVLLPLQQWVKVNDY
ncbi:uncharacterized protein AKAME5_001988600 [Lates japonicus]|uniref:G protein-coupled receptor n=1 Tax=Lates japonicus TaxID=270547 RepID=A0AAD3NA74_LATJO|nr:uncharacterized protein AKAME5_001988600 [Lates japonicus]